MKAPALLTALLLFPGFVPAAENGTGDHGDAPNIRLTLSGAPPTAIRLDARHVPLRQVLDAIAGQTGVRIHYPTVPHEFVSVQCGGETLKQVMECLLGSEADLIFHYSGNDPKSRPTDVWVLESSFGPNKNHGATSGQCAPDSASAQTENADAAEKPATDAREKAGPIRDLVAMASADDPVQRAQALSQLAAEPGADDGVARKTLESALADQDAEVRAQAVYGLSRLDGPAATAVLQAALHDSDVSVRLMAVDSAGDDVALLHEALVDSDENVRGAAEAKIAALYGP